MSDVANRPAARRVLTAVLVLVLVAGLVTVVARRDGDGRSGGAQLHTDGVALLTRGRSAPRRVTGTATLRDGDVVEAVEGALMVDLPGGARLEGRPGAGQIDATKVRFAALSESPELVAGELLVSADHGAEVEAGGNRVRLDPGADGPSAARLSRALGVAAGVYRGSATFDSAGQQRVVPALRELSVAAVGRPPANPDPLIVHADDPWDRRYLGAAMDLDKKLAELSDTYTKTLRRTEGRTVAFFRDLLPGLATEPSFTNALLVASPDRKQGDSLVGGAIASLGRKGSFADRWDQVFSFHDDGAGWGIVALDQGVSQDPLLEALDNAVNSTGFQFAQPARTGSTAPSSGPTTAPSGGPSTTRPVGTSPTAPPTTTPAGPPTTPPPVVPPATGVPPVDDLVDTVNQVVGGLLGNPPHP